MDFDEAILAHLTLKIRLRNYINGYEHINSDILANDDQCELGKWLLEHANQYAGMSVFADLKVKHATFYSVAASVAHSARSCSPEEALELLEPSTSEYSRALSDCVNALTTLKAANSARAVFYALFRKYASEVAAVNHK